MSQDCQLDYSRFFSDFRVFLKIQFNCSRNVFTFYRLNNFVLIHLSIVGYIMAHILGNASKHLAGAESEKDVQVENYDTVFEQDTYASFVPRKFGEIYPEEGKYHVVAYDRRGYIGRVLKFGKTSVTVQFVERKMNNHYDDDEVDMIYFIIGPAVLSGTPAFTIRGLDKAFTAFKCINDAYHLQKIVVVVVVV